MSTMSYGLRQLSAPTRTSRSKTPRGDPAAELDDLVRLAFIGVTIRFGTYPPACDAVSASSSFVVLVHAVLIAVVAAVSRRRCFLTDAVAVAVVAIVSRCLLVVVVDLLQDSSVMASSRGQWKE